MKSSVLENRILLLGVDFKSAPVDVRESISLDTKIQKELHERIRVRFPRLQLFTISTCNRTEFLIVAPDETKLEFVSSVFLGELRLLKPSTKILHESCYRYQKSGRAAIRRIISVATGVLSSIVGDQQILGQFKQSIRLSSEMGTMGGELDAILKTAIRAAKRVRRETSLSQGNSSLGSLVAQKLDQWCKREGRESANVCIVGAGKVARELSYHLRKYDTHKYVICNRTLSKAQEIADLCGGFASELNVVREFSDAIDVFVGAVQTDFSVIDRSAFDRDPTQRNRLYIDLGVPRNICESVGGDRYDIDALQREIGETRSLRKNDIPRVEIIIDEELNRLLAKIGAGEIERALRDLFSEVDRSFESLFEVNESDGRTEFESRIKKALHRHARTLRTSYKVPAAIEN